MNTKFLQTNGISLRVLDYPGDGPTLILLPGLTANAHSFGSLVAAGLAPRFHCLALDLRGRGLSDKPASGYTMADHAADVLGMLDTLGLETAVLVGHSFGGLLAYYLAAKHPDRIARLVAIDAARAATHPEVAEMIKPSLARLGQVLPSVDAYLAAMKQMPFLKGQWDEYIEAFYRADLRVNDDGTAQAQSTPEAIGAAIDGVIGEEWGAIFDAIEQPTLLINATEPYGPAGPIVTRAQAEETVGLLANGRYAHVPGNHATMLFGDNAAKTVEAITQFVMGD